MNDAESEPCRLLFDIPRAGVENMAIDELLLNQAADSRTASLRFYAWKAPTLSLGYFQPFSDRLRHEGSRELEAVRRLSGGGALVHDDELTYALCIPPTSPHARHADALYAAVHQGLISALRSWGMEASFYADLVAQQNVAAKPRPLHDQVPPTPGPRAEPFLCFERRTSNDVVMWPSAASSQQLQFPGKIAGSAQRRRGGALLQHGALLLESSLATPELPGLRDLSAAEVESAELANTWAEQIAIRCHLRCEKVDSLWLTADEVAECAEKRFACESWTKRR